MSVAGSLGVRAIRDGRTVSVVVSALTPEFAKRRVYAVRPLATHLSERLLDDLAVVDASIDALPLRDVARVVADDTPGVSVAFLVCGSRTTAQELRGCAARVPAGRAGGRGGLRHGGRPRACAAWAGSTSSRSATSRSSASPLARTAAVA